MKSEGRSLFDAVLKSPEDANAKEVYADWLEEHGDDRSAFLRLQNRFSEAPTPELKQQLIQAWPARHADWVGLLEQAGAIEANLSDYEFDWWGTGIGDARQSGGTYEQFRHTDLPPLPVEQFKGSFDWLPITPPDRNGYEDGEEWSLMCDKLSESGYHVPPEFRRFMSNDAMKASIKSCTDNYFTGPKQEPPTQKSDSVLLTFYADSQYCVIWAIELPREPSRYAPIIAGTPGSILPHEAAEEADEEDGDPVVAASSFEAFIYRWWIENEIWFATVWEESQRPLESHEQAYIDHLNGKM